MTLKEATEILRAAGIDDARDAARRIFSAIGKMPHYKLLSPDAACDDVAVHEAIKRRSAREPLAYVIGEVDFYRESYEVTEDTLIPRPDTEILVETAIKSLPRGARFLDLCTGSGCIALSVLNNTKETSAVAVDISAGAIRVAKKNAVRLGLTERVEFIVSDATKAGIDGDFYAVISNPPYVTDSEYEGLEPEIYFEPKAAFVGGVDGADFYRSLTGLYREVCERGGFIAYEIGYMQGDILREIAREHGLFCEIIKDLGGRDRVALLRK